MARLVRGSPVFRFDRRNSTRVIALPLDPRRNLRHSEAFVGTLRAEPGGSLWSGPQRVDNPFTLTLSAMARIDGFSSSAVELPYARDGGQCAAFPARGRRTGRC